MRRIWKRAEVGLGETEVMDSQRRIYCGEKRSLWSGSDSKEGKDEMSSREKHETENEERGRGSR